MPSSQRSSGSLSGLKGVGPNGLFRGAAPSTRAIRISAFGLALFASLALVLTFQFLPSRYDFREGDVSVYTVKSPQSITYVSQIRTREARQAAAAAVPEVYVLNVGVADQQRQRAVEVLRTIGEVRRSTTTLEAKRDSINKIPDLVLAPAAIDDILAFDEPDWLEVTADSLRILDRVMRNQIRERQLEDVRASVPGLADPSLSERQAVAVSQITRSFVKPNYLIDVEATAKAKREAQDRVEPVRVTIERGETILRDGEIVRELHLEKLQATGLRNPTFRWRDVVAAGVLAALLSLILSAYVHSYKPVVADDSRRLLVLGLLIIITVLAAKLTITGRDVNTYYAYVFPVAAASMLAAVLLDVDLAVMVTALLAVVMGLITSTSFELMALTLVSGAVGLLAVSQLERFSTILRAGLYVSIASFAVIFAFHLLGDEVDTQRLIVMAFVSVVNGLLAAGLALSAVYFLGHVFGITTAMGMLELAHPSQPLFRRLLTEAPGTYHHSVVVANLAERAAEVIGADALLCRIGSYYHDVGKVVRPYAFIENQGEAPNVHDQLDPATSARIIIAHVADGLALARRHGVPGRVQDIIAQHHGTTLAGYFYRQACQAGDSPVDDQPFRYRGPKPQSREAGVMLLADSVEAAVRANPDHSPESIAAVIRKIFQDRLADGQLDECDLTLRDLDQIRTTFAAVLQGIFHPRIEYPSGQPKEEASRLGEPPIESRGRAPARAPARGREAGPR